jgi:medium-chain acyl-[acyl-carrier-protein] hydrolase
VPGTSSWFHTPAARPHARLRLYCIPYAGGGPGVFREWPGGLRDDVEVRAVVLPGRQRRFGEPALTSVEALADQLVPALCAELDRPFAIFGHSLGAGLAYEVARRLANGALRPVRLLASGASAPHRPGLEHHLLPDAEFAEAVGGLGGTPPELLAHEELLELMLPILRADFTAAETYYRPPRPELGCPVSVFGGAEDPIVSSDDLAAWAEHTRSSCSVHVLPGDHFFLDSARDELLRLVDRELAGHLAGSARTPPA